MGLFRPGTAYQSNKQTNKQTDRLQSSGNLPLPEILDALGTNQSRKRLKTPSPCLRLVEYGRGLSIF